MPAAPQQPSQRRPPAPPSHASPKVSAPPPRRASSWRAQGRAAGEAGRAQIAAEGKEVGHSSLKLSRAAQRLLQPWQGAQSRPSLRGRALPPQSVRLGLCCCWAPTAFSTVEDSSIKASSRIAALLRPWRPAWALTQRSGHAVLRRSDRYRSHGACWQTRSCTPATSGVQSCGIRKAVGRPATCPCTR